LYFIFFIIGFITLYSLVFVKGFFSSLAISSAQLLDTLIIEDKNKIDFERMLQGNLKAALTSLIKVSVFFILLGVSLFFVFSYQYWGNKLSITIWFLAGNTIAYFVLLKTFKIKNGYGYFARIFHYIFLDNYHIGKWMLARQIRKVSNLSNRAVLVTGLARSGTTALTRLLYETGEFVSLDYSNMPFLLYPRFWRRFYNPNSRNLNDRIHNDGIKISLNSVEALEEYFFKVIKSDGYLVQGGLKVHELTKDEIELYRKYHTCPKRFLPGTPLPI
jgi:hypothetical protein